MFRVMFLIDDAAERARSVSELRNVTMDGDARIVTAFADAKTVEVFLDIAPSAVTREVVDRLAQRLGVDEYEVTRVERVAYEPAATATATRSGRLRRAAITQVRVHPDGRTVSVQARHRPEEAVETIEVQQTSDAVGITVMVGTPDDDVRDQYVSFAVAFTWVDTILDRPVGDRRIIHFDPGDAATLPDAIESPDPIEPLELIESPEPIESPELIESMQLGEEARAPLEYLGARLDPLLDPRPELEDRDDFDFDFGYFQMIGSESPGSIRPDLDEVTGPQRSEEVEPGTGSEDARVVAVLRPYRDALVGAASGQEPIPFVRKTWRRALEKGGLDADQVDAVLDSLPAGSIGRTDLQRIARAARGTDADLNLFVATMVWGRGKKNTRMLPRIIEAINDPQRATVLAETARLATAGDVERAYRAWRLSALGPPFFTKWLWTASLRGDPGTRPLILDRRVRRSLKEALGWSMKQAAGSKARAARYRAYCEAAARWANDLSDARTTVAPEDVERALCRADGRLRRLES